MCLFMPFPFLLSTLEHLAEQVLFLPVLKSYKIPPLHFDLNLFVFIFLLSCFIGKLANILNLVKHARCTAISSRMKYNTMALGQI